MYYASYSFLDGSQEPASVKFNLIDGATYAQADTLRAAIEAMSSMLLRQWDNGITFVLDAGLGVGSRETKLLIRCHDSVNGQKFSYSIPGFATGIDLITGTDFLDLNDAEAAALVAAVEAIVRTPWYNNVVVVDSIERTRGYK